eukprot:CAMPEP_0175131044 /NCGR_PEP_ID=MMETSP0087-20121206/6326_1 /TAXON_ID=136419 /ORGANISM="Unknown Unknown, Strain D1" /LENGTH=160 /DNA_ID=CAMNT_0016413295 /DNA_START=43 /DNA_END=525 /DNA_ORIENTATION=+
MESVVLINVGGVQYTTTETTLCTIEDTYFTARRLLMDKMEPNTTIFIDRDGGRFKHILNFLRSRTLHLGDDITLHQEILEEAEFFSISPLVDHLTERIEELKEQKAKAKMNDNRWIQALTKIVETPTRLQIQNKDRGVVSSVVVRPCDFQDASFTIDADF